MKDIWHCQLGSRWQKTKRPFLIKMTLDDDSLVWDMICISWREEKNSLNLHYFAHNQISHTICLDLVKKALLIVVDDDESGEVPMKPPTALLDG